MDSSKHLQLIGYLQDNLGISSAEISLALQHPGEPNNLPMALWYYGLITTAQLDKIFSWLY